MTAALLKEIRVVHQRLKATAKGTAPVTRRSAAQLAHDLWHWRKWENAGYDLPRLPRRIRVGLAKPVKAKKLLLRKINHENVQKKTAPDIKSVTGLVSQEEARELIAANHDTCMAIAQAIIGRSALAEECVSVCMASALEQIAENKVEFVSAEKVGAWICQIVRYQARRMMRKQIYVAASDVDFNIADRPLDYDVEDEMPVKDLLWADDECRTVGRSKRCPVADDQ